VKYFSEKNCGQGQVTDMPGWHVHQCVNQI